MSDVDYPDRDDQWDQLMRWCRGDRLAQMDDRQLKVVLMETDDMIEGLREEIMRNHRNRRAELVWHALLAYIKAGRYGEAALSLAVSTTDMFLKWKEGR